jgi:D-xylose transport system ATP-binding protein
MSERVEVLRHGRNDGTFTGQDVKHSDLIAAVIGTSRGSRP